MKGKNVAAEFRSVIHQDTPLDHVYSSSLFLILLPFRLNRSPLTPLSPTRPRTAESSWWASAWWVLWVPRTRSRAQTGLC